MMLFVGQWGGTEITRCNNHSFAGFGLSCVSLRIDNFDARDPLAGSCQSRDLGICLHDHAKIFAGFGEMHDKAA